jgi:hypothetical protein
MVKYTRLLRVYPKNGTLIVGNSNNESHDTDR